MFFYLTIVLSLFHTQVGKSTLILDILRKTDKVFQKDFEFVIYCNPCAHESDQGYVGQLFEVCKEANKQLSVTDTIPTVKQARETFPEGELLLILDDLTSHSSYNNNLAGLSSYDSHHKRVTVIYSIQNPFQKFGKVDLISISRNLTAR